MKWSIPTHLIEEGRQLVDNEAIKRVIPDAKKQEWYAEVFDERWYYVTLDGTAKEKDSCQCDVWQQKGYCRHTVSVELFLKENKVSRQLSAKTTQLFYYPEALGQQTIDVPALYYTFAERYQVTEGENKRPDQITPLMVRINVSDELSDGALRSDDASFIAHLWLNSDRWYEISDWSSFMHELIRGNDYALTQKDDKTVWLVREAFNTETYQLLHDLALLLPSNRQMDTAVNGQLLNNAMVKRLLKSTREDEPIVSWHLNDRDLPLIVHTENERPIVFEIKRLSDEQWQLQMAEDVHFYRQCQAIVVGNDWYPNDASAQYFDNMHTLKELFYLHQQRLEMQKDNFFEFMSYFGLLMMTHTLIRNIVLVPLVEPIEPLSVEATVDIVDNHLTVRPIYHYGRFAIPLGEAHVSTEERVLLRDINGELNVMKFLAMDGFKSDGDGFYKAYPSLKKCLSGLERFLRIHPNNWLIHYSDRLSELGDSSLRANIQTSSHATNRYLNVTFDIDGVSSNDVNRVLKAIDREQNYISLSDGRIISVKQLTTASQRQLLKTLQDKEKPWHNGDAIHTYQALGYEEVLGQSDNFQTFYHDITHFAAEDYKPSAQLQTRLADFQKYAVQWLNMLSHYALGGILADEMGLGKTVQTIAFLLEYYEQHPDARVLILAPASVLYNWQHEIERFAPSLRAVLIDGSQEERTRLREKFASDIWIASYQSFRNDREDYHKLDLDVLIMDEAQALKNPRTILYHAVTEQSSEMRIGLCGTPLENNLQEFWSLMQVVLPGLFPDAKAYSELTIDEIRYISGPFILRRTKKDVSLQLPEKKQFDRYLSLNSSQKTLYLACLEDIKRRISVADTSNKQSLSHVEILSAITRLRQICCHPLLIDEDYTGESAKFEHLKQWLDEALTNNRHILIFSQFTNMLDIIADYLEVNGISYFKLTGETKKAARQAQVDAFNRGERPIFLISLRAGGVGLNLTGADTVLLYDLWWNPSVEAQAVGRAHRIGQQNDVTVYRFITEGTIEERIAELQEEKRQLFDQLLGQYDIQKMPKLTMDDLKFILGIKN